MNTQALFSLYEKLDPDKAVKLIIENMWDEVTQEQIGINEFNKVVAEKECHNFVTNFS